MSEEAAVVVTEVSAEVVEEPTTCTACVSTKEDLENCILEKGEANCGGLLEAHAYCMAQLMTA